MKQLRYLVVAIALVSLAALSNGVSYAENDWAVDATFSGSCSCDVMCNCSLGSAPTQGFCEGSRLLEIKNGHYHGTNLEGLDMVLTRRGGEWAKLYFDETASDSQMNALVELLKMDETMGLSANTTIISKDKVKISVERTPDRVKFSVPASSVEIEMMKGLDDKPIKVENLPNPMLQDYVVYKSISNIHHGDKHKFSHSGTSGLVSRLKASSNNAKK